MENTEKKATGVRKVISKRMLQSWTTTPRVSYTISFDCAKMIDYRQKSAEADAKVSYNAIIAKLCAELLLEFPDMNASFDGETITYRDACNIGLAVDTPAGLLVPNVKDAQNKSVYEISREFSALADAAKKGTINMDDMAFGTFTLTNLGGMGIEHFTPIINKPEVAILAICAMKKIPVYDESGALVPQTVEKLVLAADHRLIDGAQAARFLAALKEKLETLEYN